MADDAPAAPDCQLGSPGLAEGKEFELPFFVDGGKLKAQRAQLAAFLTLSAHDTRPFTAVTVAIFHFLYAWNDFYEPLIFLHSRNNWTMAVGLQTFNALYSVNTHLIMAASVVMVIPPVLLFFFAQRQFIQGVVISGVKG